MGKVGMLLESRRNSLLRGTSSSGRSWAVQGVKWAVYEARASELSSRRCACQAKFGGLFLGVLGSTRVKGDAQHLDRAGGAQWDPGGGPVRPMES